MSTLLIGLDISDTHVTSALIRTNSKISIERDTYFTRLFEVNTQTDPREIIAIWIECINDLLLDFVNYYEEDDRIVGISIGIPGPMDYQSGVCLIQSQTFEKFFGLNLRLAIEYGLKNLISRWKKKYFSSMNFSSQRSFNRYHENKSLRMMALNIPTRTIDQLSEKQFPMRKLTEFCGLHDEDDDDDIASYIPRSRRETYFHDIEIPPRKTSSITARFTPQLYTIVDQLSSISISFSNDAICFALGEYLHGNNQSYQRILALTLGMNFGSAFLDNGQIILDRDDVPPGGTLWNCPYDQHSTADDWFSTRGLISIYKKFLRHDSPDDSSGTSSMTLSTEDIQQNEENLFITNHYLVRQASNGNVNAIKTFQTYARLLGQFLIPYINAFRTELIIIAGDLAQVWYLLEDQLNLTIEKFSKVQVYFSLSQGKSITLGAVQRHISNERSKHFRLTDQPLLPVVKTIETGKYDIYPTHRIPLGTIGIGHRRLNEKLLRLIERNDILLIDGFVGTFFDQYARQLNEDYYEKFKEKINHGSTSLLFYDSQAFLQTDSNQQREMYLQDDKSPFGRLASDLDFYNDFLDPKKFEFFKNNLSYPCVVIGPGSSYVRQTSPLIYIDLSKNELNHRLTSQMSCSYLKPRRRVQSNLYERKCLYYLDYPVFSKLKQEILPRMNYFIDGQRPNCPTWIDGETFRQTLVYLSTEPIRFRPCFESGPSGGQWLKTICSKTSKNYLRLSENGLIISDTENRLLEISSDLFYGSQAKQILGNELHYRLFSGPNDFPLRMNFLDTIDGGYLPLQCHPSLPYIRTNFGEKFTQDQTFYIIRTKGNSFIYLGLRENLHPEEFHRLFTSPKSNLNVEQYLQYIPTRPHEFYLIPNETIYATGPDQVILEISTSPSIYSFEFYNWSRTDSNRSLHLSNIEHGMKNLKFDRRAEQLHCQPISLQMEEDHYEEEHLPTHSLHYYDVHRLIIQANENIQIVQSTENRFHLCVLVEGDAIEIEFSSMADQRLKQTRHYNFLESFVIPASIKEYSLRPIIRNENCDRKSSHFVVLIAFLKWDCEKLLE